MRKWQLLRWREKKKEETDVFCDCIGRELENEHMEVSVHALAGRGEHKTIRIKGRPSLHWLTVAVHTIDKLVARNLKLETKGQTLAVRVANGEKLQSRNITKLVTWKMRGYECQHQFNTLRLGGVI
mgnify:CR=1 FL=1